MQKISTFFLCFISLLGICQDRGGGGRYEEVWVNRDHNAENCGDWPSPYVNYIGSNRETYVIDSGDSVHVGFSGRELGDAGVLISIWTSTGCVTRNGTLYLCDSLAELFKWGSYIAGSDDSYRLPIFINQIIDDGKLVITYNGDTVQNCYDSRGDVLVKDSILEDTLTRISIVGSNLVRDRVEFAVSTKEHLGQFTLIDSYGSIKQIVYVPAYYQENVSIGLDGYQTGMYFIRIVDEAGNSETVKFVKN